MYAKDNNLICSATQYVSLQAAADRNAVLTTEDLETWEAQYGRIPDHAVVFMYTGWDKYWKAENRTAFLGTDSNVINR